MIDFDPPIPVAVIARAAHLRAGGVDWKEVAEKLYRTRTETEAMARHPEWLRLYRLAARAVAREAEADARLERRRALRSNDEAQATVAAEETYKLRAKRPGGGKPPPPTTRDQHVRAYLDCLNAMSVEEFLKLEGWATPTTSVTPS